MDARNVKIAAPMPKFPTVTTKTSRRSCKGVLLGSTIRVFRITPHCERDPTHVTTNRPLPSEIDVPDNRKGSFSASLPMSMGSPVIAASFALNLLPSTKMPSAGTLSPATSSTRSPTSTLPAVTARAAAANNFHRVVILHRVELPELELLAVVDARLQEHHEAHDNDDRDALQVAVLLPVGPHARADAKADERGDAQNLDGEVVKRHGAQLEEALRGDTRTRSGRTRFVEPRARGRRARHRRGRA